MDEKSRTGGFDQRFLGEPALDVFYPTCRDERQSKGSLKKNL